MSEIITTAVESGEDRRESFDGSEGVFHVIDDSEMRMSHRFSDLSEVIAPDVHPTEGGREDGRQGSELVVLDAEDTEAGEGGDGVGQGVEAIALDVELLQQRQVGQLGGQGGQQVAGQIELHQAGEGAAEGGGEDDQEVAGHAQGLEVDQGADGVGQVLQQVVAEVQLFQGLGQAADVGRDEAQAVDGAAQDGQRRDGEDHLGNGRQLVDFQRQLFDVERLVHLVQDLLREGAQLLVAQIDHPAAYYPLGHRSHRRHVMSATRSVSGSRPFT